MKYTKISLLFILILNFHNGHSQKRSGIFYSTLFAKEDTYKRLEHFGDGAPYLFLKDVNGDKMDDAIAFYTHGEKSGEVWVALSDGKHFIYPYKALTFHFQLDFCFPLMGDFNGDGKTDIIYINPQLGGVYCSISNGKTFNKPFSLNLNLGENNNKGIYFLADINGDGRDDLIRCQKGNWWCYFSNDGGFNQNAISLIENFGKNSSNLLVGDVDGDGKSDLISFEKKNGLWYVALSDGERCSQEDTIIWADESTFSMNDDSFLQPFIFDIDGDGKCDAILWNGIKWIVSYSTGKSFSGNHLWCNNHFYGDLKYGSTTAQTALLGKIDSNKTSATAITYGKWLAIGYEGKNKTIDPILIDTWEAWGNDYIPKGGTYDSGDSIIIDRQIKQIHDAGFTYVTLDITNGSNEWVDKRAKNFMQRVRFWNQHLKLGDHKMYVNVSLGRTRGIKKENNFFEKLNSECKRAWEEFYLPYNDVYYMLNGKPLVIHMIDTGWDFINKLNQWDGEKIYIDKFTNRWMDGTQEGADANKPNTYGWIVPEVNTYDKEMMPVMPGFWNGITWYDRNKGETYRQQWLRVLEFQPTSVWVNSYNETWEHTSVEPSYHIIDQFVANPLFTQPWTDYYGNRMDDFYWIMTLQYNRLFMDNVLFEGSFIQEDSEDAIWKVTKSGFELQKALPVMAPVLLLPKGFKDNFHGEVIKK